MKNELLDQALRMLMDRKQYYARNENHKSAAIAVAYESAYWIMYCAVNGDADLLKEFDYFSKDRNN